MKTFELFEDEDDWEAEVAAEEWTSFKVQPREGTAGWTSFAATSQVFDLAFGVGKWGQSGVPPKGSFAPMKVSTKPGVKINYAALRDHGYKIVFFEGDPEYRKVHTKEDLPKRLHIAKSFFIELQAKTQEGSTITSYFVKQMLGETLGVVFISKSLDEGQWQFSPSPSLFKAGTYNKDDMRVFVSQSQMYNALKLKWWIKNRLIQLGMLPPITAVQEANKIITPAEASRVPNKDNNFNFRPEMRQFWFEIADETFFYDGQHAWEIEQGHIRTTYPNGSYIERLINDHIMRWKPEFLDYDGAVMINPSRADVGKPLVFMYDPKKGSPDVRRMKAAGLKPRFLEI